MNSGWIGVDLDGTLAEYDHWRGVEHVGLPVPAMLNRVMEWLAEGKDVRIFTARVSHDGTAERKVEANRARQVITSWCHDHIGCSLPVTNVKDYAMEVLWDDRAVSVEFNTGRDLRVPPDVFEFEETIIIRTSAGRERRYVAVDAVLASVRGRKIADPAEQVLRAFGEPHCPACREGSYVSKSPGGTESWSCGHAVGK